MSQPDTQSAQPQAEDGPRRQEANRERRNAPRYAIDTKVIVRRKHGDPIAAVANDISSSGMFVRLDRPAPFHLGEEVTVEVALPGDSDQPFSPWGIGQVVRLDGDGSAIHLSAGSFHDCACEAAERPEPRNS